MGVKFTRNPSAVGITWARIRLPDGLVIVTAKSALPTPSVMTRNCCRLFTGAAGEVVDMCARFILYVNVCDWFNKCSLARAFEFKEV